MAIRGKPFPEYVNDRALTTGGPTTTFPAVEGPNGRQFDYDDLVATLTSALSALYALKSGTTFTGNVVVPVATAATHAAQVSAIDAATGRLAIGGREIGNTGWRNITAIIQAAPTYAASGLTLPAVFLMRQGNTVHLHFADGLQASSVGTKDLACAAGSFLGFRRTGFANADPLTPIFVRNSTTIMGTAAGPASGSDTIRIVVGSTTATNTSVRVLYLTGDAWPATLPGTQSTAPGTI